MDRIRGVLRDEGARALVRKALRFPLKPLRAHAAARALRSQADACADVSECIELVQRFNYGGISVHAWQKSTEILALLRLLSADPPRTVLELGTAGGGTLFLLTRIAADNALLVSVDLRHGQFGGGYPSWRSRLYRSFANNGQRVETLQGDSHEPGTRRAVEALLEGRALDFLFIDGDHSYEGVKRDFADYAPLVRPGGIIAFHDIVPGGPGKHGDPGGVPVFWRELADRRDDATEFVEDWDWGSCGIGVIRAQAPTSR
jgi:predicted O-methyltransferase YrrM